MKRFGILAGALALAAPVLANGAGDDPVARGRYLVMIAGCNDCHTAGFGPSGGKVPEAQWLLGDRVGFSGPWGTTYPSNLRLTLGRLGLDEWKRYARNAVLRPPMPYWALNTMSDADLEALWRFTRSLGDAGEPAPTALPPGQEPALPVFRLELPPATP
ncbi:cytochrome C [Dokdonella sp.]|uniref:cytochrome C n=1 Tax=Dokdonella sp. TaxID=2291710 RepID=UPI0025B9EC47|nr:cytochrome C [Dokdonella sp.]MBX3692592.1 cytochrome C [Dokdonella sp.]MCW5568675.1 cytochrome C [Dokdonella sp.]